MEMSSLMNAVDRTLSVVAIYRAACFFAGIRNSQLARSRGGCRASGRNPQQVRCAKPLGPRFESPESRGDIKTGWFLPGHRAHKGRLLRKKAKEPKPAIAK